MLLEVSLLVSDLSIHLLHLLVLYTRGNSTISTNLIRGDMIEPTNSPNTMSTLEQDMCSQDIVLGKAIRVPEAKINVCVRREMEDCIDLEPSETISDISLARDVAMYEVEVWSGLQHPSIVSRTAVIELIKRDYGISWVLGYQVSDEP